MRDIASAAVFWRDARAADVQTSARWLLRIIVFRSPIAQIHLEDVTMLPIHTILHATDFSPQSETAFRLACALARDYNAKLAVLHVWVPPPVMYAEGLMPMTPPDNREELKGRLHNLEAPDPTVELDRRFV